MDVLASRLVLQPGDHARTRRFYEEQLGLAVYREFGVPSHPGVVFFLGGGFLEVSGGAVGLSAGDRDGADVPAANGGGGAVTPVRVLLQVRDLVSEHARLVERGVAFSAAPARMPWGLIEAETTDPDGVPIVLVEIPEDHPQRRNVVPALPGFD